MASFGRRVQRTIKDMDLFGVPVQLTYKGEPTFKTVTGGCLSIITVLVLTAGFAFEFWSMYTKPQWLSSPQTIDYNSQGIDLTSHQGIVAF